MTLNGEEEERQPSEIITEVSRAESKSERKNLNEKTQRERGWQQQKYNKRSL